MIETNKFLLAIFITYDSDICLLSLYSFKTIKEGVSQFAKKKME